MNEGVTANSETYTTTETIGTNEETSQGDAQQSEGSQSTEAPKAIQPNKKTKKINLKIDGSEIVEDLPFEIDESDVNQMEFLRKHLQMSKAASKRMNEAALMRKNVEKLMADFNENPMAVLKKLDAKKARSAAEEYLLEQIKQEMETPEEKEKREKFARLHELEENEKKRKEDEQKSQAEKLKDHYAADYQKKIIEALNSAKLPKNTKTIQRMAYLLDQNLDLGLELTVADLAEEVKKSYFDDFKELIKDADAEFILSLFGDDVSNKIRKYDLAKLHQKLDSAKQDAPKTFVKKEQKRDYMTMDEWRESLRK